MSQDDEVRTGRAQVSLSSVYRQLDDHLGPEEARYDVQAGLERLVAWMTDERPAGQVSPSREFTAGAEQYRERNVLLLHHLQEIERTARLRMRSSYVAIGTMAFLSLLAGVGLLFGLSLVPAHAVAAVVVVIGIVDAVIAFVVGFIHRATMKSLQHDLDLSFAAEAERSDGRSRQRRETAEPEAPVRIKAPDLELVQARPRWRLLTGLAGVGLALVASGAYLAAHTSNSWVAITIAGALVGTLLTTFSAVVIPAVWSKSLERRNSAQLVLYALLGLTARKNERRTTRSRSKS